MPSPVDVAVDTYIRSCSERDRAARDAMLEACWATDGRLVARSREIRGRAALAEFLAKFLADPNLLGIRVTSAVETGSSTFRFHSVVDFRNGTSAESFDAGEVDAAGRISLILTFAGPLGAVAG